MEDSQKSIYGFEHGEKWIDPSRRIEILLLALGIKAQ